MAPLQNDVFERVPAIVFACLKAAELRIIAHPGVGLADGGIPVDVPVGMIPADLRLPNTRLWIHFDANFNLLHVWRREENE